MSELGERFARAIAAKDRAALAALLADDVDFKGLTPGRFWEAASPAEVVSIVFDSWFEEFDHVTAIDAIESGASVGDMARVGYRFALSTPGGPRIVEQQAYYTGDDRVRYMRVVCSGFRAT